MIILYILTIFFIISPFFPATGNPHWFFRTADFVRLQSLVILGLLLGLLIYFEKDFSTFTWILIGCSIATMLYQLFKVIPYSSLYPRRQNHSKSDGDVSIFAGNVLQTNENYAGFISEVKRFDPQIVLAMETNKDWENGLSELEKDYPYTVKVPQENFYGMHVYSKSELENVKVNFQIEEDIPSIFFEFPMKDSKSIFFACLHPAPPTPTENETAKERDAELMLTGEKIRENDNPAVVFGDMNDVVWSRATRLFKKMTGMVDPRVGRGFFATYNANFFFLRFPLDHLFHTRDLYVGKMIRSKNFGSDHFAMYYEIHHKKKAVKPNNPTLDLEEKEEINDTIREGVLN